MKMADILDEKITLSRSQSEPKFRYNGSNGGQIAFLTETAFGQNKDYDISHVIEKLISCSHNHDGSTYKTSSYTKNCDCDCNCDNDGD